MLVDSSGSVCTFGRNDTYQLGHGDTENQSRPRLVSALQGMRVISVAAGGGLGGFELRLMRYLRLVDRTVSAFLIMATVTRGVQTNSASLVTMTSWIEKFQRKSRIYQEESYKLLVGGCTQRY